MSEIKLTKNALRDQQKRFDQLQKYLPTLQLKKAMLQLEVSEIKTELREKQAEKQKLLEKIKSFSTLLGVKGDLNIIDYLKVEKVDKRIENIAGVEVPMFEGITFTEANYFLFDAPIWFDSALNFLKEIVTLKQMILLIEEKKAAMEKELRDVSIRVNLFEKVLIPRAIETIKKIKIFLGDQQLSAVAQAKVAKTKIMRKHAYQG